MKTEIFKVNPNLKEVHMTSDGQAFYNEPDAKMHAKTLDDKNVELVMNPKFLGNIEVSDATIESNDGPVLESLTKAELVEFAKLNYKADLNVKDNKPTLLKQIAELVQAEGTSTDEASNDEASNDEASNDETSTEGALVDGGSSIGNLNETQD